MTDQHTKYQFPCTQLASNEEDRDGDARGSGHGCREESEHAQTAECGHEGTGTARESHQRWTIDVRVHHQAQGTVGRRAPLAHVREGGLPLVEAIGHGARVERARNGRRVR